MKKLLLSLGAIASVAAPVAAVVACGSTTPGATPGKANGFTLVSTKTDADLKAITATQVQNASTAAELNTLFGMKAGTTGFIFKGSDAKFDAATLTVKFTHNEGGTLVAQTWTVTPTATPTAVKVGAAVGDDTVQLGQNTIGKQNAGFTVVVNYLNAVTGKRQDSGVLFSKVDPSKFTKDQEIDFLDYNFEFVKTGDQESAEPKSFWTDEMLTKTFDAKFTKVTEITKPMFILSDSKAPANWVFSGADLLAHHTKVDWKKQGATDAQLIAFEEYIKTNDDTVTGALA